ncbi:hypothetical protein KAU45_02560 [bacterium]|nr:hypothetical protein [bacterium]
MGEEWWESFFDEVWLEGGFGPAGDWLILQNSEPDYLTGRMVSRWLWVSSRGERHEREIDHRIYAPHELVNMGKRHGLEMVDAHGDCSGSPVSRDYIHMYLTFRRT